MKITEKSITGKKSQEECEDGIVVSSGFIAVIDGSTSKTPIHINAGESNGRYCMELVKAYICGMAEDINVGDFCKGITDFIYSKYLEFGIDTGRLKDNPVERLTASAVVYSAYRRQIWMIGDCQCLVNGRFYDNPKPQEAMVAEKRSAFLKQALADGLTVEEVQNEDPGRKHIINEIIEGCKMQNKAYSVIDGFSIPMDKIRVINVDDSCTAPYDFSHNSVSYNAHQNNSTITSTDKSQDNLIPDFRENSPTEIILASDGYPFLKPTLAESEAALKEQLEHDPLCINTFKATKGLMKGLKSFDDRTFIRFSV